MHLSLILEMAADGLADRTAIVTPASRLTYAEVQDLAVQAARRFDEAGATAVLYLGTSHAAFPVALFGAGMAGIPIIPLNYRLGPAQLDVMVGAHPGAVLLCDDPQPKWTALAAVYGRDAFMAEVSAAVGTPWAGVPSDDADRPAVMLYTSGTTAAPKAAILRHRHLTAYLFGVAEFGSAEPEDAGLVSVPPYHVAGLANLLSNFFAGRRVVYLPDFAAGAWLDLVRAEGVTNALVVPAMLARIVDEVGDQEADVPTLRALSYGGARTPIAVLEKALLRFPNVGFVNAYGLTETSSTVALLGPDDHRAAMASDDPLVRGRLASAGRPLPTLEVEIRDEDGGVLPAGEVGLLFVRGEQVAGEYTGRSALDEDGWFPTRDRARIDADGYLYVEGRADDTIIRGGENIAPAEIEDELSRHPGVADVVVVGVPDDEWGQRLAAVVVRSPDGADLTDAELKDWVRARLRSSKTPDQIEFRTELPRTDTGKLLRRVLVTELQN
jgi:acyl-CoA synthetase (AMP-forming)/AMP-acid ligase II